MGMFPVVVPVPTENSNHVSVLEADLDVALGLLSELTSRLRDVLGEQALGLRLTAVADASEQASLGEFQRLITHIIAESEEGSAARQLRDLTGVTWDEAYALRNRWNHLGTDDRQRLVLRMAFRNALRTMPSHALPKA